MKSQLQRLFLIVNDKSILLCFIIFLNFLIQFKYLFTWTLSGREYLNTPASSTRSWAMAPPPLAFLVLISCCLALLLHAAHSKTLKRDGAPLFSNSPFSFCCLIWSGVVLVCCLHLCGMHLPCALCGFGFLFVW